MTEYIEKGKLLDFVKDTYGGGNENNTVIWYGDILEMIHSEPAADVAAVRHGEWERVKNPRWPAHSHDKCSVCGWWNTKNALCYDGGHKPGHSLNYCPNCGAKMEAEE